MGIFKIVSILTVVGVFFFSANGQNKKLDSLIIILNTAQHDTIKVNTLIQICMEFDIRESDQGLRYAKQGLQLAEKIKNKNKIAKCYYCIGFIYNHLKNLPYALINTQKSLNFYEEQKDKKNIAMCFRLISLIHEGMRNPQSISYLEKSLTIYRELNDKTNMEIIYNDFGNLYSHRGKWQKAIEYYKIELELNNGNKEKMFGPLYSMGLAYEFQGDLLKAINYYQKALKIATDLNNKEMAITCNDQIGDVYSAQGNYASALEYLMQSLKYYIEIGDKEAVCFIYEKISRLKCNQRNYQGAIEYCQKILTVSKETQNLDNQYMAYQNLYAIYDSLKDYKKAYEFHKLLKTVDDSLKKVNSSKELLEVETKYQSEKKQKEIELLNKDKEKQAAISAAESKKQKIIIISVSSVLLLVFAFAFFAYRSFLQKRKANVLLAVQKQEIEEKNEELNQQNEEISTQRDEIETQRDLVTQQKASIEHILHEVNQSIDYAQRIQTTILPELELLEKIFNEYFVLYKPKDKVSGDFYWWAEIEGQIIVTVADCTGHGVPGAFMTMLGSSFLREIVQKEYITDAAVILRKLRKEIIKALKQKGIEGEQKDGMDMALVSINKETKLTHYAGAHNSLLLVKNPHISTSDSASILEFKADKMPIAIYDLMDNFTTHEIFLNEGDMLYMYSDGFVDQFGGKNRKKFLSKNFRQMISEISIKSMTEQKELLNITIESWKGDNEQTDDITVLGLKI